MSNVNDEVFRILEQAGYYGCIPEKVYAHLVDMGYGGNINDMLYCEQVRGQQANGGPAMYFLSHIGTEQINGESYEIVEYFPVATSLDQGIFFDSPNANGNTHYPQGDAVMTGEESNVSVQIISGYFGDYLQNRFRPIAPSYVRNNPNDAGGVIPFWPPKKDTSGYTGNFQARGDNAVRTVQEFQLPFEMTSVKSVTDDKNLTQMLSAMLGISLEDRYDGNVVVGRMYPMFENQHSEHDRFEEDDVVKYIDGVHVNKDNVMALILSKPAGTDATVVVERTGHEGEDEDNHDEEMVTLTRKRFQRYNTILKLD